MATGLELVVIAAVARNGVIGRDNALLWSLPEDMRHFRAATMGAPVVMGRKTWDSLPARFRPLLGRHNIVLTRQAGHSAPGASVAPDLHAALALARADGAPRVFVIGGEQVYRAALPHADTLLLTEIARDYEGDAHFPAVDPAQFVETAREPHRAEAPGDAGIDFAFVTYRRRAAHPPNT